MSLALLFHYLMLNMFRMLIHPSWGDCDLFVELFHGLYCSGTMCVGVTLWFGWGGVVSGCRLQPAYGYHTTPAEPQEDVFTLIWVCVTYNRDCVVEPAGVIRCRVCWTFVLGITFNDGTCGAHWTDASSQLTSTVMFRLLAAILVFPLGNTVVCHRIWWEF